MKQTAQLRRRNVCAARIKLPGSALVEYRPKAIFSSLRICDDNGPKGLHAVRCQEEEGKKEVSGCCCVLLAPLMMQMKAPGKSIEWILTSLLRLPSVLFVNWPLERWQWWSALEQIHSKTLWHLTFTISIRHWGRKTKKCRLVKMKRNEEQLSFHFWCRLHIPDQMNHRRIEYTCRHPDDSRRLGFRVSLPKGGVLNEEGLSRRVAEEMFSNKSRDNVMKWRGEKQERAIHTLRVSMMWCWRTRNLWRLLCLVSKSLTFSGFKFRSRHRAHTPQQWIKRNLRSSEKN